MSLTQKRNLPLILTIIVPNTASSSPVAAATSASETGTVTDAFGGGAVVIGAYTEKRTWLEVHAHSERRF